MPRLFTGLEIPSDIATELSLLRGGLPGARWIEPEDYHLTLRFIGDIQMERANDIAEALASIAAAPFSVKLERLAVFGSDKPRALIARTADSAALTALQLEHERLVRRLGAPAEKRKFTPHVTLARLRGVDAPTVGGYIESRGDMRPLSFEAKRFVLYSSRESTGGGPYRIEAVYPFAPARARGWAD
ncbi:MAG: RNA 2',3'-cyclic phosphodiesterase [Rhodoblastus sp.]|nr:RNA 2',3'-cyclic phosphodiesterase [Rhodoblastus sp.]MCB1540574.1 RNA 2',3'-cyclic phosphodiesterase [Rhodoblastus sp.]